jgi:hypothetical protein
MSARRPDRGGAQALRAALRRMAQSRLAKSYFAPPNGHWPPPETAWERATEARLGKIEQQLFNQNRLLLVTFVSILADVALGLTR